MFFKLRNIAFFFTSETENHLCPLMPKTADLVQDLLGILFYSLTQKLMLIMNAR